MPRNSIQNEQMRAESRERILTTARRLFARQGYDGCTVSDIAREAGMSQGNIYWYFPSKEALLKAVLSGAFEALGSLFSEVLAYPGSGREKLDYLIERYIAFGREQGGGEVTIIIVSLTAQGGLQRLIDLGFDTVQIGGGFHHAVSEVLAQAQAEAGAAPDMDPDVLAIFFISLFNGLAFTFPDEARDIPLSVLHAAVLRLVAGTGS